MKLWQKTLLLFSGAALTHTAPALAQSEKQKLNPDSLNAFFQQQALTALNKKLMVTPVALESSRLPGPVEDDKICWLKFPEMNPRDMEDRIPFANRMRLLDVEEALKTAEGCAYIGYVGYQNNHRRNFMIKTQDMAAILKDYQESWKMRGVAGRPQLTLDLNGEDQATYLLEEQKERYGLSRKAEIVRITTGFLQENDLANISDALAHETGHKNNHLNPSDLDKGEWTDKTYARSRYCEFLSDQTAMLIRQKKNAMPADKSEIPLVKAMAADYQEAMGAYLKSKASYELSDRDPNHMQTRDMLTRFKQAEKYCNEMGSFQVEPNTGYFSDAERIKNILVIAALLEEEKAHGQGTAYGSQLKKLLPVKPQ